MNSNCMPSMALALRNECFSDPQSPWQRGSNENTDGLLRQYLPKKADLSHFTQSDLDKIGLRLNQQPLFARWIFSVYDLRGKFRKLQHQLSREQCIQAKNPIIESSNCVPCNWSAGHCYSSLTNNWPRQTAALFTNCW
jgi:hypothetical protein